MTLAIAPSLSAQSRQSATWADYLALRDDPQIDWRTIAFAHGWPWIDMGKEGPNHASFSDLLTAIFFLWALRHSREHFASCGRCLLEKLMTQDCAPDLVLYKGETIPRWRTGEPRRIDLTQHRGPDLVGEISDTTLSQDLDEQKHLYARLGVPEYWVIGVKGLRLFAFQLTESGQYQPCSDSRVLEGLAIRLIEQTPEKLPNSTNTGAAQWFARQLEGR
jgi:Uma2 family endonuclease